jgi:Tol biopolymer transport system component
LPSWSADGSSLYFSSDRTGTWQLWSISVYEKREAIPLTQHGGYASQAAMDGGQIIFTKPDTIGLWALSLQTGTERLIAEGDQQNWAVTQGGLYFVTQKNLSSPLQVQRLDLVTEHIEHVARMPADKLSPYARWGLSVSPNE